MNQIDWTDPAIRRAINKIAERERTDPFTKQRLISHLENGVLEIEDLIKEAK